MKDDAIAQLSDQVMANNEGISMLCIVDNI